MADPQLPAQDERKRAVRLGYEALERRERTVAELRAVLERKRIGPAAIEAAVEELRDTGYLDDATYARRFAEDRRELQRWGRDRIARDLRRRGVEPEVIEAALSDRGGEAELEAAVALLTDRLPRPPEDDRARDRAWQLLVRRGYEPELAYEAVRVFSRSAGARSSPRT
jgi:regulatory protein